MKTSLFFKSTTSSALLILMLSTAQADTHRDNQKIDEILNRVQDTVETIRDSAVLGGTSETNPVVYPIIGNADELSITRTDGDAARNPTESTIPTDLPSTESWDSGDTVATDTQSVISFEETNDLALDMDYYVRSFKGSDNTKSDALRLLYQATLMRTPSDEEIASWLETGLEGQALYDAFLRAVSEERSSSDDGDSTDLSASTPSFQQLMNDLLSGDTLEDGIRHLYGSILQREPSDEEVASWVGSQLEGYDLYRAFSDAATQEFGASVNVPSEDVDSFERLMNDLLSGETLREGISSVYTNILFREPSEDEISYWADSGLEGYALFEEMSSAAVVEQENRALAASLTGPEKSAGINKLYQDLLDRQPSEEEVAYWANLGVEGLDLYAEFEFAAKTEIQTNIAEAYRSRLQREPSSEELEFWTNLDLEGGSIDASLNWAMEEELVAREKARIEANLSEIFTQYRTIVGCAPSDAEISHWLNQDLSGAELRDAIAGIGGSRCGNRQSEESGDSVSQWGWNESDGQNGASGAVSERDYSVSTNRNGRGSVTVTFDASEAVGGPSDRGGTISVTFGGDDPHTTRDGASEFTPAEQSMFDSWMDSIGNPSVDNQPEQNPGNNWSPNFDLDYGITQNGPNFDINGSVDPNADVDPNYDRIFGGRDDYWGSQGPSFGDIFGPNNDTTYSD